MKIALITSITGQAGSYLAELLLELDWAPKTAFEDMIAAMVEAHRARLAIGLGHR